MRSRLLGSIALLAVLAGLIWLHRPAASATSAAHPVSEPAPASTPASPRSPDRPTVREAPLRSPEQVLLGGSLRGTAVDGDVHLAFAGHIQPDIALRRLFDYYLSLLGETDLDGIRQLVHEDLEQRTLDGGQVAEAMALFARYTRYLQARSALARLPGQDLGERLRRDRALRLQILGAALAQAFYPDVDANDRHLLGLLNHRGGRDMPVAAADPTGDALAPAAAGAGATLGIGAAVQLQTAALDAAGASVDQRQALRTARWGKAAAERLAELDRQRAQWQQRLDRYASAVQAIRSDSSLTPEQRRRAVEDLLARRFQGPQRLQVQAMFQAGLLGSAR